MSDLNFTYMAQPPRRYTFQQPKLRAWVEWWCKGSVLNLFCGTTKLNVDEVRVDLDPDVNPDYCTDAYEIVMFCVENGIAFDTLVLDPPNNYRKAKEKYGDRWMGPLVRIRNELPKIMNDGGRVIGFGYGSVGMGKVRGFEKIALCLVCHNGEYNDTIGLVEEMRTRI